MRISDTPEKWREYWREQRKKYRIKHPDRVIATNIKWRSKNPDKVAVYIKKWTDKNADKFRQYQNKWARENRIKREESCKKWRLANPDKWMAIRRSGRALDRARKLMISSNTSKRVNKIYSRCCELRKWFDVQVDHIIPISRGGKHEARNLQIIYAFENLKKGNRLNYHPRVIFR